MSEQIPVNPVMLRWARETSGFDIDDVVVKLKRKRITTDTVASQEEGAASPTYVQQERLKGKPVADPFVIAKAKIPNVCNHFGILCINLDGFMEKENWTFQKKSGMVPQPDFPDCNAMAGNHS